jgi:hypothetical protein
MVTVMEQHQFELLWFNPSQEVGQQQKVVMPPLVLVQANTTCAQGSGTSSIAQPCPVNFVSISTPCLLLYLVGRARKPKEVAEVQVDPDGGLFEGNMTLLLYACVQVQHLLKSSYADHKIDILITDGKHYLGECFDSTILWYK